MRKLSLSWILIAIFALVANGDDRTQTDKSKNNKARVTDRARQQLTPERLASARTFVQNHYPELAELLLQLEENHKAEYQKAMRDLYRTSERLGLIRDRDEARYRQELTLWKIRSRIQLLTAKIRMQPNPKLLNELEAALNEELDVRISYLAREKMKLESRASKMAKQIDNLEKSRKQTIRNQIQQLSKSKNSPQKPTIPTKASAPTKKTVQ